MASQQQQAEGPSVCETCAKKGFKALIGFHKMGTRPDGKQLWFIYDWETNNEHKHVSICKFCNKVITWKQEDGRNVPYETDGVTQHRPICESTNPQTTPQPTTQVAGTIQAIAEKATSYRVQDVYEIPETTPKPETTNPIMDKLQEQHPPYSFAEREIISKLERIENLLTSKNENSFQTRFDAAVVGMNAWINSMEKWMADLQRKTNATPFTSASNMDEPEPQPEQSDVPVSNKFSTDISDETKKILYDAEKKIRGTTSMDSEDNH